MTNDLMIEIPFKSVREYQGMEEIINKESLFPFSELGEVVLRSYLDPNNITLSLMIKTNKKFTRNRIVDYFYFYELLMRSQLDEYKPRFENKDFIIKTYELTTFGLWLGIVFY